MEKQVQISLTQDEIEMLVDALEVDLDGYVEAADQARGTGSRDDVTTFNEAAQRIQALKARLEAMVED